MYLALVHYWLFIIKNEYFIILTYIPLEDLNQNVLKEKKVKPDGSDLVFISGTPRGRHTQIVIKIRLVLAELHSRDCFRDV